MSIVDMARDPLLSGMSRGCTTPRCDAAALVESPFCNVHQATDASPGPGNDPSLKNSLPRVTNFSGRRVVARRGHSRIRMPSSGRASVKPQSSPNPNDVPKSSKVLESQARSGFSPEKHGTRTAPNPVVSKDRIKDPLKDANIDRYQEQHLVSVNAPTFGNSMGENGVDPSNTRPSKQNHHTEVSAQPILGTKDREGKHDDLSDAHEKTNSIFSSVATHSTPKETQIAQDYEDGDLDDEAAQGSPLMQVSISTSEPLSNGQSPDKPGWAVTSPAPNSPTQSLISPNTTDSGEVSDDEIDDEDDEDEEPFVRTRFGKRRYAMMDHDDTRSTREPSLEPECNSSQRPQSLTEEPDDDSVPMDLETSAIASQDHEKDDPHGSGTSNSPHANRPAVSTGITRSRLRSETSRAKRLADFDSAAFDALIYQQVQPTSPKGVLESNRPPRKTITPTLDDRLSLNVNPAIHRMHNRSEEWFKKKAKEIEDRGGRKTWFGKVHERQRHIRARESEAEKERQSALRAGLIPPRQDPQPRVYKRRMDFGDVPEKDLPDYVQSNKAWMKACAWHREMRNQATQRHAHAPRTAEDAKRNSVPQKRAEEAEGSLQAPRTTAEIERQRHVQRATEEARRFYMKALKRHAVTSKGSSK
ncbi:hypothetical protein EDB81DRAFT_471431 [Dactylonectria macrodidyma]|uniref:Uncharacterized protein n=1 Tax=Dactylonectria macrodidyma TaxID=307937 RepID=A0A9P9EYA0_9HYPO|nr:hypothetical protein EDB81DRAFT_471431 [Dactylonectria macrodidyma]